MIESKLTTIIEQIKQFPQVKAIAIGGSSAANTMDKTSDIDVYVFTNEGIDVCKREEIIAKISSKYEVGGEYFGSGDEFLVDSIGIQLDVMYWNVKWFEDVVKNVWEKHYPSNGYTTCFLYTLSVFNIIYDTENWLKTLQESVKTDYPAELQQNIIKRNVMLMKDKPFASYYEQIEKAIKRNDLISINHRVAAFMASYFDVIFALNKLLHPGEKRLLKYALEHCTILPADFEKNINKLYNSNPIEVLPILDDLILNLKAVLPEN